MDKIGIIGVPYNTGSKGITIERGAEALREAGIVDVLKQIGGVIDFGDLRVTMPTADNSNPKLLKPNQVEALCKALAFRVKDIVKVGYLPFIVGGECSAIMGVIEGLRNPNRRLGLVYMDAHGDFNTPETTPSGIIGGMDLAITAGRGPEKLTAMFGHSPLLPEENIVLCGVRDLDFLEAKALAASRVTVHKREEIRLNGGEKTAQDVLNHLESKCDCVYLHVDLDVLDSSVFSAAGLPEPALNQRVPASNLSDIINYLLNRKNNAKADSTISRESRSLKQLSRIADLNNTEEIKTAIAHMKVSNTTKHRLINHYSAFLKWKHITWEKPTYKPVTKIPFIPTEQELDQLIASCGKKMSTYLQLLKETGMRIGEAQLLKWTDLNLTAKTVNITPEKDSNPRILPISDKLISMLNTLPQKKEHILPKCQNSLRNTYDLSRQKTSQKLANPRLIRIGFHTFRHYKGTMEYHKTKDIMHVKYVLGHKDIKSTMIYINLEQALFTADSDEWTSIVTHNLDEETKAIHANFQLVRPINETTAIYKKRK